MIIKYFCCALCNYKTKRNFDLKRHQNAKHKNISIINESKNDENKKDIYKCIKCNKSYKTEKNFTEHEKNCLGIDSLIWRLEQRNIIIITAHGITTCDK